jgi:hypothetical protein
MDKENEKKDNVSESNTKILNVLQEKVLLKQEVFEKTQAVFEELKKILSQISTDLKKSVQEINPQIITEYKDLGKYEVEFTLADETLIFAMHSNVFTFDKHHPIWNNKYVQKDTKRSYCGKIFIYNFLSDSFRYNRTNDVGYLIGRIFVNREGHFFVEGRKQLGYLYHDFPTTILDSPNIEKIIQSAILYCLDFDPFTPPFDRIEEISVKEVLESSLQSRIATGKRLGFEFETKQDPETN